MLQLTMIMLRLVNVTWYEKAYCCSIMQDLLTMSSPSTANTGRGGPASSSAVTLRETPDGDIVLDGVAEVFVQSSQEVAQVLEQGNSCRAVAAHK